MPYKPLLNWPLAPSTASPFLPPHQQHSKCSYLFSPKQPTTVLWHHFTIILFPLLKSGLCWLYLSFPKSYPLFAYHSFPSLHEQVFLDHPQIYLLSHFYMFSLHCLYYNFYLKYLWMKCKFSWVYQREGFVSLHWILVSGGYGIHTENTLQLCQSFCNYFE